eukprot:NODE_47_length_27404_cov_0.284270.p1 type:complete len:1246 gc:universal NODE_47_length_27404_cov_0.284270:7339-11076(+)
MPEIKQLWEENAKNIILKSLSNSLDKNEIYRQITPVLFKGLIELAHSYIDITPNKSYYAQLLQRDTNCNMNLPKHRNDTPSSRNITKINPVLWLGQWIIRNKDLVIRDIDINTSVSAFRARINQEAFESAYQICFDETKSRLLNEKKNILSDIQKSILDQIDIVFDSIDKIIEYSNDASLQVTHMDYKYITTMFEEYSIKIPEYNHYTFIEFKNAVKNTNKFGMDDMTLGELRTARELYKKATQHDHLNILFTYYDENSKTHTVTPGLLHTDKSLLKSSKSILKLDFNKTLSQISFDFPEYIQECNYLKFKYPVQNLFEHVSVDLVSQYLSKFSNTKFNEVVINRLKVVAEMLLPEESTDKLLQISFPESSNFIKSPDIASALLKLVNDHFYGDHSVSTRIVIFDNAINANDYKLIKQQSSDTNELDYTAVAKKFSRPSLKLSNSEFFSSPKSTTSLSTILEAEKDGHKLNGIRNSMKALNLDNIHFDAVTLPETSDSLAMSSINIEQQSNTVIAVSHLNYSTNDTPDTIQSSDSSINNRNSDRTTMQTRNSSKHIDGDLDLDSANGPKDLLEFTRIETDNINTLQCHPVDTALSIQEQSKVSAVEFAFNNKNSAGSDVYLDKAFSESGNYASLELNSIFKGDREINDKSSVALNEYVENKSKLHQLNETVINYAFPYSNTSETQNILLNDDIEVKFDNDLNFVNMPLIRALNIVEDPVENFGSPETTSKAVKEDESKIHNTLTVTRTIAPPTSKKNEVIQFSETEYSSLNLSTGVEIGDIWHAGSNVVAKDYRSSYDGANSYVTEFLDKPNDKQLVSSGTDSRDMEAQSDNTKQSLGFNNLLANNIIETHSTRISVFHNALPAPMSRKASLVTAKHDLVFNDETLIQHDIGKCIGNAVDIPLQMTFQSNENGVTTQVYLPISNEKNEVIGMVNISKFKNMEANNSYNTLVREIENEIFTGAEIKVLKDLTAQVKEGYKKRAEKMQFIKMSKMAKEWMEYSHGINIEFYLVEASMNDATEIKTHVYRYNPSITESVDIQQGLNTSFVNLVSPALEPELYKSAEGKCKITTIEYEIYPFYDEELQPFGLVRVMKDLEYNEEQDQDVNKVVNALSTAVDFFRKEQNGVKIAPILQGESLTDQSQQDILFARFLLTDLRQLLLSLDSSSIAEIKSYKFPPKAVLQVMQCVLYLFGKRPSDVYTWPAVVKFVNFELLKKMASFDPTADIRPLYFKRVEITIKSINQKLM